MLIDVLRVKRLLCCFTQQPVCLAPRAGSRMFSRASAAGADGRARALVRVARDAVLLQEPLQHVPARHAEIDDLLRGEVDAPIRAKRCVVGEFHTRVLRREGVAESLHDRERRVPASYPIDAGKGIGCGSRRAATGGREKREHEEARGEGQGAEDRVASGCEAVADR